MNVTINHPGDMTVSPKHVTDDGRELVYANVEDSYRGLVLWMSPETAAQWIEALTPLAAKATP
jgi:hypothetical protein